MTKCITQLWKFIINIGITSSVNLYELKVRQFFNAITFVGIIVGIGLTILTWSFDVYITTFRIIWILSFILALYVHSRHHFKVARFIVFTSIYIFYSLIVTRVGHEFYPHFASLGIVVACFMMHDLKKEWGWLVFYMTIEIALIILTESNVLKVEHQVEFSPQVYLVTRSSILIGTIIFVMFQFIYFIRLSVQNERKINDKLQTSNSELVELNKEKSVLLREVHHRVKNNLQIISSLLNLQSSEIVDEKSKEKFLDTMNRVQSISALHRVIYNSDNLSKINLESYLREIAENIIKSYGLKKQISYSISSELATIENDSIVPISLILNELMSNSLKHGFSLKDRGEINVTIQAMESNKYTLNYSDNGSWKVCEETIKSFGTELIYSLTEQLNGEVLEIPTEDKSSYIIEFHIE